jgi:hypothetical protein
VIENFKSTSIWLIVALILSFCAVLFFAYGYETVRIDGTLQTVRSVASLVLTSSWHLVRISLFEVVQRWRQE